MLELLLLVVDVRLSKLLKKLSEMILRVVKLSFLTEAVNNVRDTNGNASGLNSIKFSSKDFFEINGVLRALIVLEGLFFKISKYLWVHGIMIFFLLIDPSGCLISLIPLYTALRSLINLRGFLITFINPLILVTADDI